MKQPDIGPFGVLGVVLALLQIGALSTVSAAGSWAEALVVTTVAAATGRVAAVQAAGTRVASATRNGLGTLVAGTASRPAQVALTVSLFAAAVMASGLADANHDRAAWVAVAVALGLGGGWVVRVHSVRRLGGVTGDVFGALVEVAATITLVLLAAKPAWR
jgi:adenosylcobinamide-GDP ribazoletransferase